ncbi:MAG: Flp pilus assembly protein CpaB [Pseudomonadota bacterium]
MVLRILILVFALGAAGGAAWLTMSMSQQSSDPQAQASAPVATKDVLVATSAIAGGEVLSPSKMRWQPMPEQAVNEQFILRDTQPEAIAELSGSFVNRSFSQGEPIRSERLMATNINLLSNKITPGKRAAAVKISAENTAGGFILPGDRVDVIQTITKPGPSGQPAINVSEIIISNVRVLAIDQTAVQTPEGSAVGKTATLELSPEDAERIMAAEASGLLSLALRSVTDHAETLQDVLVVVDPITEGDQLTADNLRWQPVSNPQMHPQYIRRDEQPEAIETLSGSFVDRDFAAGEALREARILKVNINLLSHRLEKGMRAASVKISAESTAGGFILPGDRVDVIHTVAKPEQDGQPASNDSEVIIRNVKVLAIDQTAEQTAEGSAIGKTATLELLPQDAERIVNAEASGLLTLALRSVSDHAEEPAADLVEAARTVRIHRAAETTTITLR